MPEDLSPFAHAVARVIELFGIAVIVIGALIATIVFLRGVWRTRETELPLRGYRTQLGQAILLGLEFLVAADIIATISVEPTYESLGVLGLVVLIRTFLSFSLEVEINGHWPWQRGPEHDAQANRRQTGTGTSAI